MQLKNRQGLLGRLSLIGLASVFGALATAAAASNPRARGVCHDQAGADCWNQASGDVVLKSIRNARCPAMTIAGVLSLWAGATLAQPADLSAAIRKEGLRNSQAMTYVTELADGIGGRLPGSPNMRKAYDWSLGKLGALGAADPRLEDIGEFGLGWRQNNAWLSMSAPDSMVSSPRQRPGPSRARGRRPARRSPSNWSLRPITNGIAAG